MRKPRPIDCVLVSSTSAGTKRCAPPHRCGPMAAGADGRRRDVGAPGRIAYHGSCGNCITIHGVMDVPPEATLGLVNLIKSGMLRLDHFKSRRSIWTTQRSRHHAAPIGSLQMTVILRNGSLLEEFRSPESVRRDQPYVNSTTWPSTSDTRGPSGRQIHVCGTISIAPGRLDHWVRLEHMVRVWGRDFRSARPQTARARVWRPHARLRPLRSRPIVPPAGCLSDRRGQDREDSVAR